jgi:hypothetical protein
MHNSPFPHLGVGLKLFFMLKRNTFHHFFPTACNSGVAADYDNIISEILKKYFFRGNRGQQPFFKSEISNSILLSAVCLADNTQNLKLTSPRIVFRGEYS